MIVNPERGTREKRFKDGRVEIWYSNGNRKEISGDQSVVSSSVDNVSIFIYTSIYQLSR